MYKRKKHGLHGNAPGKLPVALLIIDMINDLEFPGGDEFNKPARMAADAIAGLKRRAKDRGFPSFTSMAILGAGSPVLMKPLNTY